MSNNEMNLRAVSRQQAIDYYRFNTLGLRIASVLPRFALFGKRKIIIDSAPIEVVERYEKMLTEYHIDNTLLRHLINSRLFGFSGLFLALAHDNSENKDKISLEFCPGLDDIHQYRIGFNTLDPLPLSNTRFSMDCLSPEYMIPVVRLKGKKVHENRIALTLNKEVIFQDNSGVGVNAFAPPSVYTNIAMLMDMYDAALNGIMPIINKAGALVYKGKDDTKLSVVKMNALERVKSIIRNLGNGEVLTIDKSAEISDFPIGSMTGLSELIEKLESAISVGVGDTPRALLFDQPFNNGLSDGSEDFKATILAVKEYQDNDITPLYNFVDRYLFKKCLSDDFIMELKYQYKDLQDKTTRQIKEMFIKDFKFEYAPIDIETAREILQRIGMFADNMKKLKEIGVSKADLENEINNSKLFTDDFTLEDIDINNFNGGYNDNEQRPFY